MPHTGSICSARALGSGSLLNLIQATAFLQKREEPMFSGEGRKQKASTALRVVRIRKAHTNSGAFSCASTKAFTSFDG